MLKRAVFIFHFSISVIIVGHISRSTLPVYHTDNFLGCVRISIFVALATSKYFFSDTENGYHQKDWKFTVNHKVKNFGQCILYSSCSFVYLQKPIMLHGHERSITQIKYNREGDLLFSCAKDNQPNVWYALNGERLGSFKGHGGAVWCIDVTCILSHFVYYYLHVL